MCLLENAALKPELTASVLNPGSNLISSSCCKLRKSYALKKCTIQFGSDPEPLGTGFDDPSFAWLRIGSTIRPEAKQPNAERFTEYTYIKRYYYCNSAIPPDLLTDHCQVAI